MQLIFRYEMENTRTHGADEMHGSKVQFVNSQLHLNDTQRCLRVEGAYWPTFKSISIDYPMDLRTILWRERPIAAG